MIDKATFKQNQLMASLLWPQDDPHGKHTHVCDYCQYAWSHENGCINDEAAHTCRCGKVQWNWRDEDQNRNAVFQSCVRG